DARRDGDVFGKGACALIFRTRNAEDLAVVAKIDLPAKAGRARATVDGRVEGDAVAFRKFGNTGTGGSDDSCGFVSHDNGRNAATGWAIIAVNIAAANAACGDADQNFSGAWLRIGKLGELEVLVVREEQGFHFLAMTQRKSATTLAHNTTGQKAVDENGFFSLAAIRERIALRARFGDRREYLGRDFPCAFRALVRRDNGRERRPWVLAAGNWRRFRRQSCLKPRFAGEQRD